MLKKQSETSNIVGVFDDEDILVNAIRDIKNNKVKIKNVYTPFPIHAVIHELGLKTRMPYAAFIYAAFGTVSIFAFLFYSSVIDFPIVVGGKPSLSLSFVVILFVMTINVGIVLSLLTFFGLEKLYPGKIPVIAHHGITDDKFVIVIEKEIDWSSNEVEIISALLKKNGAIETSIKQFIGNN